MTNETQQTGGWKAWSEKTWVVVVSGVFMPPVGIILAWLKPDWSSKTKWIATCVMGLLLIGMISADNDENSKDAAPDAAVTSGTSKKPSTSATSQAADDLSPTFSNPELKDLAGRFIQNEIRPGWSIDKVLAVMGTPTKIEKSNGFLGQTPEQQSKFLADPLIPPSVKRSMQEETAICTWSSTEDPGSYFIKLWFQDGILSDDDLSVSIVLPK